MIAARTSHGSPKEDTICLVLPWPGIHFASHKLSQTNLVKLIFRVFSYWLTSNISWNTLQVKGWITIWQLSLKAIAFWRTKNILYVWKSISLEQWKGINRKQSTRWQHLSQLKASAFFSLQKNFSCYETQQLILGTGTAIWWLTEPHLCHSVKTT